MVILKIIFKILSNIIFENTANSTTYNINLTGVFNTAFNTVPNLRTNFNSTIFGHINNNDYLCRTKEVDNLFIRYIGSNLILVESPMSSSVE